LNFLKTAQLSIDNPRYTKYPLEGRAVQYKMLDKILYAHIIDKYHIEVG